MNLTKDNIVEFAWQNYNNPQLYNGDEFFEDMQKFFYVKKLVTRYKKGKSPNMHLTLNHIITLINLFGPRATREILKFYIQEDHHDVLNSFFNFLSILPENDGEVNVDRDIKEFLESI